MAGMGETRRRVTGVSAKNGYIIAETAATVDGAGGCMLAISAKLPFALKSDSELQGTIDTCDVNLLAGIHRGSLREYRRRGSKR